MTKAPKVVFVCQSCGAQAPKWMGRCVDCGAWNSLVEERVAVEPVAAASTNRYAALGAALTDSTTAAVLVDLVIGYGAHPDPAGMLVQAIAATSQRRPVIVASVTGTDADPQNRTAQVAKLQQAGVLVAAT